jgi:DNA-binding transcriptional regulator GbsR (MarR family)
VVKIEKSAKRANKMVFELQREQFATRQSDAIKEEPKCNEKASKDLEARVRALEKNKLNKSDFEAIGSRLLKMKTSVETVKQVQKWTTQAVETILA